MEESDCASGSFDFNSIGGLMLIILIMIVGLFLVLAGLSQINPQKASSNSTIIDYNAVDSQGYPVYPKQSNVPENFLTKPLENK